jgi:hypothetical protein
MVKARLSALARLVLGRREQSRIFAGLVTLSFVACLIAVHAHHELWRDEVHCWSVGRNSSGLWDLLVGDRRYDGHPFLWYYTIFLASQVWRDVAMLHVLGIFMSGTAAYLWLRHSGLPRVVRLLVLGSYLFFYEYGVLSRSYTQGALLLFCFATIYRRQQVRYLLLAVILTLLALTSLYGAIMSGALAMFLFTRGLALFQKDASGVRRVLATRPGYFQGLVTYVAGIVLTGLTSMPPQDEVYATVWYTKGLGIIQLKQALLNFWWAFVSTSSDWSSISYLGMQSPGLVQYLPWCGAALLATWVLAMRRAPMVAWAFLLSASAMGFFQVSKYPGGLRHVGNIYLFALCCAWLTQRELAGRARSPLLWLLVFACAAVQLPGALSATRADLERPFSGAREASLRIAAEFPSDILIIGSNDSIVSAVAGYLDHAFLFADTGDFGQSVVSHNRRVAVTPASMFQLARDNLEGRDRLLLVTSFPLMSRRYGEVVLAPRFTTAPSIVSDDRYYVYEARRDRKR